MVISTSLLSYFIDISNIDINDLCQTLNDIGIEVEGVQKVDIPSQVVVGKVISKSPHPNADKLNVCQVDVGTQTLQIVCGAKNVEKDQFVALAMEGAVLPINQASQKDSKAESSAKSENEKGAKEKESNKADSSQTESNKADSAPKSLIIKRATLRGIESCGMICSATELGLQKINEGIMVLDSSIGELVISKPLNEYPIFSDYLIEISITPNRGDCLSVLGIARELACAYSLSVRLPKEEEYGLVFGVGRALNLIVEGYIDSLLLYKAIEIKSAQSMLAHQIILAYNGLLKQGALQNYKAFVTLMSGVLFNLYPLPKVHEESLPKSQFTGETIINQSPITLRVKKDSNSLESIYDNQGNKLATIGVKSEIDEAQISDFPLLIIIEANYTNPESISKVLFANKLPQDKEITYRSMRGSNPELLLGMNLLCSILNAFTQCSIYSGHQEVEMRNEGKREYVNMTFGFISEVLGKRVEKEDVASVLKRLNFKIDADGDGVFFRITPPIYRHDIHTAQDVAEEFLRIYRIKNIPSIPYSGAQKRGINEVFLRYQNERDIALRAISAGFYETIHYVFCERKKLELWGFDTLESSLELTNPITSELDTLRTSLLPSLLDSVARNHRLGYKNIKAFELGIVYDAKRAESKQLALVASGLATKEAYPYPKGQKRDFYSFSEEVSRIIGEFELVAYENPPHYAHPYQSAKIIESTTQKPLGMIAMLNPAFASKLDLADSCEVFFAVIEKIPDRTPSQAKPYARLHANERDLSVLIDENIAFSAIKKKILESNIAHLHALYPLDIYKEKSSDKQISLTIRAVFMPSGASLTEEQLAQSMAGILAALESSFQAKLKA